MKKLTFLLILTTIIFALLNTAYAGDFYYNGTPQYNPYNGYTVMSLPPPPPMNQVPFYVRDDYDDYLEDYYECILGYEHHGLVCRYWRNYAEKNGFYQKTPQATENTEVTNNVPAQNNMQVENNTLENNQNSETVTNQYNKTVPYTPVH